MADPAGPTAPAAAVARPLRRVTIARASAAVEAVVGIYFTSIIFRVTAAAPGLSARRK